MEDSSGLGNEIRVIFIILTLLGNAAFSLAELAHTDFFPLQLPSFISGQTIHLTSGTCQLSWTKEF